MRRDTKRLRKKRKYITNDKIFDSLGSAATQPSTTPPSTDDDSDSEVDFDTRVREFFGDDPLDEEEPEDSPELEYWKQCLVAMKAAWPECKWEESEPVGESDPEGELECKSEGELA